MKPIKVMIVDDSVLIRSLLASILSAEPDIIVVDTAADPFEAREKIKLHNPDVLTLDIEMPRMDGLSFLEKIMALRPMPVIMASSLTQHGADATVRALELGAFDTVGKPASGSHEALAALREELLAKVRAAAVANIRMASSRNAERRVLTFHAGSHCSRRLIAIGASTGGVEALRDIFMQLPGNLPPIAITQHMPELFTASFAHRLDALSAVRVVEASHHDRLKPGHAYIAPGGKHLRIMRIGTDFVCKLEDSPPVSSHRPSVDVLFHSVAEAAGAQAVGVILTGMGKDGAAGLRAMRDRGAHTVGQDQESCVVYGMPQVAMKHGAVIAELPLSEIPRHIIHACEREGAIAS